MEEIAEAWISEMEWECCASALVVWGQTQRYGPEPVPSPSQNLVLRSAPLLPVWSGVVTLTPSVPIPPPYLQYCIGSRGLVIITEGGISGEGSPQAICSF